MLLCSLDESVPTFSCVIGQDGASSGLPALRVLPGAGVGAERPGRPGAEGAVLRAGHLTDGRHGQDGITTQLSLHMFTCTTAQIED